MSKGEKYAVYFHPEAYKELESYQKAIQAKINEKISLLEYPFEGNAIKLKGEKNTYRIREGRY